jgi:DNA-directed RNA polymerase specialized sigma24 family protein
VANVLRSIRKLAPSLNDADLVLAARTGEAWAREALFRRHADAQLALAFRLLGPYGGTREVVERAFVESFDALSSLRDPAAFSSWTFRNTVRRVRLRLSQPSWFPWRRKRPQPDFIGFRSQLVLAGNGGERAEIVAFYECLEELPLEPRLAVLLRGLDRLDTQEIASAMQAPTLSVRRWLLHADRRLRPLGAAALPPALLQRDSEELPIPLSEFERAQMYRKIEAALGGRGARQWLPVLGWTGAGLVAVTSVGLAIHAARDDVRSEPASLALATLKPQSIELPDGSRALVSPSSQLRVDVAEPQRIRLTLVSGHADFEIADATGWTFVVSAGDTSVSALGRRLSLSVTPLDGPNADLTVEVRATEGPADVQRGSGGAPLTLGSGESWTGRVPRAPLIAPAL